MTYKYFVCFFFQLAIALVFSTLGAVLQTLVVVVIAREIIEDGICSSLSISFISVVGIFLFAGLVHPQEILTLIHGFLFFLLIPCMYLILSIYALCNLHVVSWGTRESKPQTTGEPEHRESENNHDNNPGDNRLCPV